MEIGIDYSQNIAEVREILLQLAAKHELILQEEETIVFVSAFDASAITIGFRFWTKTENYWAARWDVLEKIKAAFDKKGISIPFDQLDVNLVSVPEEKVQTDLKKRYN